TSVEGLAPSLGFPRALPARQESIDRNPPLSVNDARAGGSWRPARAHRGGNGMVRRLVIRAGILAILAAAAVAPASATSIKRVSLDPLVADNEDLVVWHVL